MIPGINRVFQHDGTRYLVECEDLGTEKAAFEIRIIAGGSLIWQKGVSYQDLLDGDSPPKERDQALRNKMEKTVKTAQAAIAQGKIGG